MTRAPNDNQKMIGFGFDILPKLWSLFIELLCQIDYQNYSYSEPESESIKETLFSNLQIDIFTQCYVGDLIQKLHLINFSAQEVLGRIDQKK